MDISCKLLKSGRVAADGVWSPGEGIEINTVAVGTPDNFLGSLTVTSPGQPPLHTPVDSKNMGEASRAGDAARLGKLQLQKCWGKVGPSI